MNSYRSCALAALVCLPLPALADACLEEVRTVYATETDPFVRPPYQMELTVLAEDGSVVRVMETWVETPLNAMSGMRGAGMYVLLHDRESWTGPSPDGPWTKTPTLLPEGRRETAERMHAEEVGNITDAICHGEVEHEGHIWVSYSFTTKTDPDPDAGDNWFGARTTLYLDPETRLPGRYEQTLMVSKWAPEPSTETNIMTFTYDEGLKLPRPGT